MPLLYGHYCIATRGNKLFQASFNSEWYQGRALERRLRPPDCFVACLLTHTLECMQGDNLLSPVRQVSDATGAPKPPRATRRQRHQQECWSTVGVEPRSHHGGDNRRLRWRVNSLEHPCLASYLAIGQIPQEKSLQRKLSIRT